MPANTLSCPECNKVLKLAAPLPAGKKVKCPRCQTVITVGASADRAGPGAQPKSAIRPSAAARPRPVDDDEFEDRGPSRRRRVDPDDEVPARKSSRRAALDREDDPDEAEVDDEDDYRPRKSARGKKKSGNALVLGLALGGGAGLLVVVFLVLAFVKPGFLRPSGTPTGTQVAVNATPVAGQPGGVPAPGGNPPAANPPAGAPAGQPPAVNPGGQPPAGNAGGPQAGPAPAVNPRPAPGGPFNSDRLVYQFRPGETYIYAATIVADRADVTETYKGHVHLAVKSAEGNEIRLTPSANLPRQVKDKQPTFGPPGAPRLPRINPPSFEVRALTIDPYGRVLNSSGDTHLPYLLGDATDWVVEPLSPKGEKRWDRATDLKIREIKRLFPFARMGPSSASDSSAREVVTYEVAGVADPVVRIKKTYELKTTTPGDQGPPRIWLDLQGELAFDARSGVVQSCDYRGNLTLNEKDASVRVPLTVSYRLLDAAEAAALKKEEDERRAKALEAARLAAEGRPITDAEITQALADLKSDKWFTVQGAATRLAGAKPVAARRDEVAGALEALLQNKDGNMRAHGARGLKVWGTAKNAPALIKTLADDNLGARDAALEALGKLKDPRGAEAAAPLLGDFRTRGQASAALKAMGPVAEKPVVAVLKHSDWGARVEACKVLAEVGTKDSVPALQAALTDSNRLVSLEAERAIQAINGRKAG